MKNFLAIRRSFLVRRRNFSFVDGNFVVWLIIGLFLQMVLNASDPDIEAAHSSARESHLRVAIPENLRTLAEPMPVPSPPGLQAVARVANFQALDLDGDGLIDVDEERLAQFAIQAYFYQRHTSRSRVLPYLRRRIRQAADSPINAEREGVAALQRLMAGERISGQEPISGIQELVLKSVTEALHSTEEEVQSHEQEVHRRIPRRRAVCGAAISSTITAILGAAAALIVNFTQGNC